MTIREKKGFRLPAQKFNLVATIPLVNSHWTHVTDAKFDALVCNITWDFVPRRAHTNVLFVKWCLKHKFNFDLALSRYKTRCVCPTTIDRL